MSNKLSDRVAVSMFRHLLPAQMMAILVANLNSILDSLLIGNFMGSEYLAVFGFVGPLSAIHAMLSGSIAAGSQILCGRYMGRGDFKKIGATYAVVTLVCIVIGSFFTLTYELFPTQIASLLGASDNAQVLVTDYLRGYGWSMIFMLFSSSMIPFLQLNNAARVMTLSVFTMTIVNLGGNLLNVFVVKNGMFGYGFASSVAYFAFTLIVVFYYFSDKCTIQLDFGAFAWSYVKKISVLGFPSLIYPLCLALRNLVFNNVAVRISGTKALTAMAVMVNIAGILGAFIEGIPAALSMTASVFYGERDKKSLREVAPIGLRFGALFFFTAYIPLFLFTAPLVRLFGAEPEIVPFLVNALRIIFLILFTGMPYSIVTAVYKGTGRTRLLSVLTVINMLIVPVPACLLLSKLFGINGVWLSFLAGEVVAFPLCLLFSGKKLGHFPRKLTEIVYIPETFGASDDCRLDAVIRSKTDVSEISQRIIRFCREKRMDEKTSFYCGLCVEEIAVLTLERGADALHGKTNGHEMDVRIIFENEGLSVMLRDNYPNFDPLEWARICKPEDRMRSLGIRMVTKLADKVDYSMTLNLNVFFIHIALPSI